MGKKTTDKPIDKTIYQTPKGYFMEHDCTERISEQKSEYEELMEADTKAGKLVQNAVASVRNQKGQDEIEEAEAMEKINQYLAAHGGEEGNQYLVRGAELVCTRGSNQRKLNLHVCHGVYIKGHPVVHELDCIYGKNITWFGACDNKELKTESIILVGDDGRKHGGKKCEPHIVGVWMDTYDGTKIVDNGNKMVDDPENPVGCNTLTVGSFLVCKYGGIITPISSGQDREVKETEFIEGEAAYNRVMNFKCEEESDRADVHGSAFLMEEEGKD